jgi:hypothetical protein
VALHLQHKTAPLRKCNKGVPLKGAVVEIGGAVPSSHQGALAVQALGLISMILTTRTLTTKEFPTEARTGVVFRGNPCQVVSHQELEQEVQTTVPW